MMDYYQITEYAKMVFRNFNGRVNKNVLARLYFVQKPEINACGWEDFNNVFLNLPAISSYNDKTGDLIRRQIIITIIRTLAFIEQLRTDPISGEFLDNDNIEDANIGFTANYIKEHLNEFGPKFGLRKRNYKPFMTYIKRNIKKYDSPSSYLAAYYNTNPMDFTWYVLNCISDRHIMLNAEFNESGAESSYEYFKYIWYNKLTTINFTGIRLNHDQGISMELKAGENPATLIDLMNVFSAMYNYEVLNTMHSGVVYILSNVNQPTTYSINAIAVGEFPENKTEEDKNNESVQEETT